MKTQEGSVTCCLPLDYNSDAARLFLETCDAFDELLPRRYYDYARELRLCLRLQEKIDYWCNKAISARRCIGIHVRLTAAHNKTLSESPVVWFERKISEIIKAYPDFVFFLSTDSLDVQERLVRLFPSRILHQQEMPEYNSIKAVQKALVDLHVLAKTSFILGSYHSSFSYMAAGFQGGLGYEDAKLSWGKMPDFSNHESDK